MDKENERWKFAAVRPKSHNNSILSFLAPHTGALAKAVWISYPERAMQWDSLAPIPDYRHYSPPPFNCLCNALYHHLSSRSATGAEINGTGRLLARAGYVPPVASHVFMVYVLLC